MLENLHEHSNKGLSCLLIYQMYILLDQEKDPENNNYNNKNMNVAELQLSARRVSKVSK